MEDKQAPAAPITPAAPVENAEPVDNASQVPSQADLQEDAEWEAAAREVLPGVDGGKHEEADDKKAVEDGKQEQGVQEAKKQDEELGKNNDADKAGEGTTKGDAASNPTSNARDTRVAARDFETQVNTAREQLADILFPNRQTELTDGDGDPIRTLEDVMGHVNPLTNEPFTEEEAGMWLLSAQKQHAETMANDNAKLDNLAELNVDFKFDCDYLMEKYGKYFENDKALQQQVWNDYIKETGVKLDAENGFLTEKPAMSVVKFYDLAMAPLLAKDEQATIAAETQAKAQEQAAETAKKQAEIERKQNRADRADIYGPKQQNDKVDKEEEEWAEAAKAVGLIK